MTAPLKTLRRLSAGLLVALCSVAVGAAAPFSYEIDYAFVDDWSESHHAYTPGSGWSRIEIGGSNRDATLTVTLESGSPRGLSARYDYELSYVAMESWLIEAPLAVPSGGALLGSLRWRIPDLEGTGSTLIEHEVSGPPGASGSFDVLLPLAGDGTYSIYVHTGRTAFTPTGWTIPDDDGIAAAIVGAYFQTRFRGLYAPPEVPESSGTAVVLLLGLLVVVKLRHRAPTAHRSI